MTDSLNEFLQDLARDGHNDSEGQFTLSLSHSLDKLSEFQLLNPNLFVLNLVSAALLSGASWIRFRYDQDDTSVDFDGRQYDRQALQAIFDTADPALAELRTAMISLHAQKPHVLRFESLVTLDFSGRQASVEERETKSFNTLVFQRDPKTFAERLRLSPQLGKVPPWLGPLKAGCQYAPIDIMSGETAVFGSRKVHMSAPCLQVRDRKHALPPLQLFAGPNSMSGPRPSRGEYSAALSIRYEGANRQLGYSVGFVYRGVCYTRHTADLDLGGLVGLVYCENLKKNLSQTDIVEDETYRQLLESLRLCVLDYVQYDLTQTSLLPELAKPWFSVVKWAGDKLLEQGKGDEAIRIEAWAYAHLHAIGEMGFSAADDLGRRYPSPAAFLRQYLHWKREIETKVYPSLKRPLHAGTLNLLKGLSQAMGKRSDPSQLLQPWIDSQDHELLLQLFDGLLPLFPEVLPSETLAPLVLALHQTHPVDQRLLQHVSSLKRLEKPSAQRSFCAVSLYLMQRELVDPEDWLERAFQRRLLIPGGALKELLLSLDAPSSVIALVEQAQDDALRDEIEQAQKLLDLYINGHTQSLGGLRVAAKQALARTAGTADEELFRLVALAAGSSKAGRPSAGSGPWSHHRYALALMCQGNIQESYHHQKLAHNGLQSRWESHLLVAEAALLAEDLSTAQAHAQKALEFARDLPAAQELLAESTPPYYRRQAWSALAQDPRTPDLLSALYYQEALMCGGIFGGLIGWIRLKVGASAAEQKVGRLPLPRDQKWLVNDDVFSELVLRRPEVVRYLLRDLRASSRNRRSAELWARACLLQQLKTQDSLGWKPEYLD